MQKRKTQLIFQAFQTMDVSLLRIALDDYKTYQNTYKEVFIQKLEGAFGYFKASGDTRLEVYAGVCLGGDGEQMCENCGASGYRFVGNRSKCYLNFVFKEGGGYVQDIYYCNGLRIKERQELSGTVYVEVFQDERVDFVPSEAELTMMIQCKNATEELAGDRITDLEAGLNWCERYRDLATQIGGLPRYYYNFPESFWALYQSFRSINELATRAPVFIEAMADYEQLDSSDDQQLIRWLLIYRELCFDITLNNLLIFLKSGDETKADNQDSFTVVKSVKIAKIDIPSCVDLIETYTDNSNKMYDRYHGLELEDYLTGEVKAIDKVPGLSYHRRMVF